MAAITSRDGAEILTLHGATVVRKPANPCGGIAGMSEPAAQLGVSILGMLGAIVFDPMSDTVWITQAN
jgi:hypothetical protein